MNFKVQKSEVYSILEVSGELIDHGAFMELRALIKELLEAQGSYLIVHMSKVGGIDTSTLLDIAAISRRFEEYVGFLFFTHVPHVILERIPDLSPFAIANDQDAIALIQDDLKKLNELDHD